MGISSFRDRLMNLIMRQDPEQLIYLSGPLRCKSLNVTVIIMRAVELSTIVYF
jgi:hypothetical protein